MVSIEVNLSYHIQCRMIISYHIISCQLIISWHIISHHRKRQCRILQGEIEGRACHSAERVIAVSGVLKEEAGLPSFGGWEVLGGVRDEGP
jgi:hypothetical protein